MIEDQSTEAEFVILTYCVHLFGTSFCKQASAGCALALQVVNAED